MAQRSIHFGAGALGRGLVVPRLVEAGWSVTVVDPLPELLEALRRAGGYWLEWPDGIGAHTTWVPLAAALHPQNDRAVLQELLTDVPLVTTAVRKENLGRVATNLVAAWEHRNTDVALLGCENVERVDELLTKTLLAAGLPAERLGSVSIPRTVVDRICASDWPASTTIRTEQYAELAATETGRAIPGVLQVADIDARFDRKRYLVNTLADAAAILGGVRGYTLLSQAFLDAPLLAELEPLIESLTRHLVMAHGFRVDELQAYVAASRRRLANPFIPRRLDTVARDVWRKMLPGERFFAPLIDLAERGESSDAALPVMARLVLLGAKLEGAPVTVTTTADHLRKLGQASGPVAERVYEKVALIAEAGAGGP